MTNNIWGSGDHSKKESSSSLFQDEIKQEIKHEEDVYEDPTAVKFDIESETGGANLMLNKRFNLDLSLIHI